MIIVVCGDRAWRRQSRVREVLLALLAEYGPFDIIEGGTPLGADRQAWAEGCSLGCEVRTMPADWVTYGRAAGPIRNRQMLDLKPDLVVAFHNGIKTSRGTKDCVQEARRRGIPVRLFTETEEIAVP